jgi:hypothetical protein
MIEMPRAVADYLSGFGVVAVYATASGKIGTTTARGLARRIGDIAAAWWTSDARTANEVITALGERNPATTAQAEAEVRNAAYRVGVVLADHSTVLREGQGIGLDRSTFAWGAPSVEISADECKILAAAP